MTTVPDLLTHAAGHWRLAPDRSTVSCRTKTLWGLATVTTTFTEFTGEGLVADGVAGRMDIRAGSLQTGIRKRDEHLRSADFFDVENHPDIVIEVRSVEPAGADGARLQTTLTVRGTSRPLEFPVSVRILDDNTLRTSGGCTIERSEFGVSGNMLGMIGRDATVSADLVFVRA